MCGSKSKSESSNKTVTTQEDNRVGASDGSIAAGKGATLKAFELSDEAILATEGGVIDIDADSPEAFALAQAIATGALDFARSSRDTERTIVSDALGAVQQARQDEQTTLAGQALKWVVPAVVAVALVQGLSR